MSNTSNPTQTRNNQNEVNPMVPQTTEDVTQNQSREVISKFFNRLFENAPKDEYLLISSMRAPFSTNRRMTQEAFLVRDLDKAVEYAVARRDCDVWVTPTTFGEPTRKLEETRVNSRRWIYADHDVYHYQGDRDDENRLDALKLAPTMKVETSPGSFQLYWDLGEHVTDVDAVDTANRAMVESHVSDELLDNAVKEHNRILRVPGTTNLKPHHNGWTVRFDSDNGEVTPVGFFGLRYDLTKAKGTSKKTKSKNAPNKDNPQDKLTSGDMHPKVRRAVERHIDKMNDSGSRHIGTYNTLYNLACYGDEGLTGVDVAVEIVRAQFEEAKPEAVDNEFDDMLEDALGKASAGQDVPEGNDLYPAPGQWDDVAEQLSRKMLDENGNRTLVRASGEWYVFSDRRWIPVRTESVNNRVRELMRNAVYQKKDVDDNIVLVPWSMSVANLTNIESALYRTQSVGSEELGAAVEVDTWIGRGPGSHTNELMPLNNGLLDPVTRKLYPHSAGFFNMSIVEMDFDPNATETPSWDYLLESQWGKESGSAQTLHEWIGYTLLGRIDLQKGLYIVGETRTGKGVIARTLQNMVGKSSYTSVRVDDLTSRFGLSTAIGKKLITIAETERGAGRNEGFVVALKNAIGQDHTQIDRKNREPWVGPLGNFLVTSNFAPEFQDSSGAAQGRFIVLHTPTSFLGKEDPGLEARIAAETPAILNKALDAYDALRARGKFAQPEAPASLVESMSYTTPMEQFMGEYAVVDPNAYVTRDEFRSMYLLFCEDQGYAKPTSRSVTDQINRATGYKVETSSKIKVKNHEGKWVVGYKGLGLKIDTSAKTTSGDMFFASGATLSDKLANAHNPGNTSVPDEAPKVAATDDSVKAPEKPVEAPSKETRTLTLEDGRKVVCEDLTGSWDTKRGQFRVSVYDSNQNLIAQEEASGSFLNVHRGIDPAAFTE